MSDLLTMFSARDKLTRRRFLKTLGVSASMIAAFELARPGLRLVRAEPEFTIAMTGGTWAEVVRKSFIEPNEFEKRFKVSVAYSYQSEPVAASKILAQCGRPPFSVSNHDMADATLLASAGCIAGYDLNLVPNYKFASEVLTLQDRQIGPYFASAVMPVWGLVWNTKLAKKPASYRDMWSASYKGKVGVPAYDWQGMIWLHAINKLNGGDEDNITPGIQAVAELVKKNDAIIVQNVDHAIKSFQSEEIVIAPFWNGRTFAMQNRGLPVAIEYVENASSSGIGFVIARGTAFPEVAQRFVNETLDGRNQLGMSRVFLYPPADRRVKLPSELERLAVPERALRRFVRLDWKKVSEHRSDYLERWNKEVLRS